MTSSNPSPKLDAQRFLTVQEMQKEFSDEANTLLLPNHPAGTAFLKCIYYSSDTLNISNVDYENILAEAVYLGLKYIQTHRRPILVPKAWLRVTCLNLLRNQMRETIKQRKLSDGLKESSYETESPLVIAERFEWIDSFHEAINQLPPNQQELVQLRIFGDKTYEQIHHWLELRDGQAPSIPTIRKSYSRAMNQLKQIFPKIYQASPT